MGLAYLPDGTRIDYNEYIRKHPRWQSVRKKRFDFDDGRCVVCHKDLHNEVYQTHHLHYQRLGHERLRDVVTLCEKCHKEFHESWHRSPFWTGKEAGHWETYDIMHTAQLCAAYWRGDKFINRDPNSRNLCGRDACIDLIDDYYRDFQITKPVVIDPNDISLFVRNKRYELFFEAEKDGKTVEEFLDEYYGPKVRGKNPLRQEAGRKGGPFDHTPASFHKNYSENKNIVLLMDEVAAIEAAKTEESKITF